MQILAAALRHHDPWLEWAGKQEAKSFAVDPVALHIHERVSAKAIVTAAQREDVQRELFADPQQVYHEVVQSYQHDVDWSNRLILGDSLTVMSSLAHREDLAGRVQMIYIDPPYGIKFASNFQPTVFERDVKDRESDLTREREQIKAYRDTWTLGVHSYLAYLRDRLLVAKELLTDSGSIFVQISDENVHRVRSLMDEVFGSDNFVSMITFRKTTGVQSTYVASVSDYLLWFAKDKTLGKFRELYREKTIDNNYNHLQMYGGEKRRSSKAESHAIPDDAKIFRYDHLLSAGASSQDQKFNFQNQIFEPPTRNHWKTSVKGLNSLANAGRIEIRGRTINYLRFLSDFPLFPYTNFWNDTTVGGDAEKIYVVQTTFKVIQRCLLMTTDPGDLVLDPTCGSGTTAFVAEQWGRRWITIDTSRVAVALARQRLLTSSFKYYVLTDESKGVVGGFINKIVPHITLKSIAQNTALDPIFVKHEPILEEKLKLLNRALGSVTPEIRTTLRAKLAEKQRHEGKRAVIEADRRRWELPADGWKEWEVPFDTNPD